MASSEGSASEPSNSFTSNPTSPSNLQFDFDQADSFPQIALEFRIQAEVLEEFYVEATALDKKERIMNMAIECARKAVTLNPNSMDFNSFLGHLFCRGSDYIRGVEQFNTALNIQNPNDPAEEILLTEAVESRFPTYEARIEVARTCILKDIGNCLCKLKELKAYSSIKGCLQILKVKNSEEMLQVAWYALSSSEKRRLLEVSVVDLKSHLISSKDYYDVFAEALSFFEIHQKWEFWMCSTCDQKFPTAAIYLNHVLKSHLKELLTEFRDAFPLMLIDWIAFIEKIKWKPLDTSIVITALKKTKRDREREGQVLYSWETLLDELWVFNNESLLSKDSNRSVLLSKIRDKLQDLTCSDWLMGFHVKIVIEQAINKLRGFLGDLVTEFKLEHYCLCLLDASQLEGILKLLEEISNFAAKALGKSFANETILGVYTIGTEIEGDISLIDSFVHVSLSKGNNKHHLPITDDWISWICSGPSSDEHLIEWRNLEDQKTSRGKEELAKFENCLSKSLKNLHEFQEKLAVDLITTKLSALEVDKEMLAVDVTPTDVSVVNLDKEIGSSSQKPEADNSLQSMIHEKRENDDSVLSESERRILEVAVGIQQSEIILSCVAGYSYRPILLSIMKSYFREHLEGTLHHFVIEKYDAATGEVDIAEKEIEHTSLHDKLDHDLQELNKCEHKEAEMKSFATVDTSVLKQHYEKKVHELELEKKALMKEIDDLRVNLANMSSVFDDGAQKLKEEYLQKLNFLEKQVTELKKQDAQSQLLRQKQKSDEAAKCLQDEIHRIKRQKVQLQHKIKQESEQFRQWKASREKEVLQLKKEGRRNEYEMHKLLALNQRQKMVLQRKTEEASMATRRFKELLEARKASSRNGNGPGIQALMQAIEHELEVVIRVHDVRMEYERQLKANCSQTMSPGASNSRIFALENMLATSPDTLVSMTSQLSEAEEREREFSGKRRWSQVRSLPEAKDMMNHLFNLASSSRCLLRDKEVDCRDKDSTIRELKEKIVRLSTLVRQLETQNKEILHREKLRGPRASFFNLSGNSFELPNMYISDSDVEYLEADEDWVASDLVADIESGYLRKKRSSKTRASGVVASHQPVLQALKSENSKDATVCDDDKPATNVCCSCSRKSFCKTIRCKCRSSGGTCGDFCSCAPTKCTNRVVASGNNDMDEPLKSETSEDPGNSPHADDSEQNRELASQSAMLLQSVLAEKPSNVQNERNKMPRKPLSNIGNDT